MARKRKKIAEVDWCQYFHKIQGVCPWSYSAWKNGKIDIVRWQGVVHNLDVYDARVYVHINSSARLLNKWANRLNANNSNYEWLWSHPQYHGDSTPVPVLVQQDRAYLTQLRNRLHK